MDGIPSTIVEEEADELPALEYSGGAGNENTSRLGEESIPTANNEPQQAILEKEAIASTSTSAVNSHTEKLVELLASDDVNDESSISIQSLGTNVFDKLVKQLEMKPDGSSAESLNGLTVCRICFGTDDKLCQVCHCKGSIGHVHVECIERWLQECGMDNCDLCKYKFITVRKPTQSKWRSLVNWVKHEDNQEDMIEMLTDFAATFLFCPFVILLSISGVQAIMTTNPVRFYVTDATERVAISVTGTISAAALGSMLLLVNGIGLSWLCFLGHKHYSRWHAWYRRSTVVKIILPAEIKCECQINDSKSEALTDDGDASN